MRIMGIDPGSLCTGYGIVEQVNGRLKGVHWDTVRSSPRQAFPQRLKTIYDGLVAAIETHAPDTVAIEDVFFAVNAKSTIKLGQTRGVAILAAVNAGVALAEYTPLEVKQSLVGYGRADKTQVRDMVCVLLGLRNKPEPLDASDALAVAICHLHHSSTNQRLKAAMKG